MAYFYKKTQNGKTYLYIRESARVNGKPKVVSQVYLGSASSILERLKSGNEKIKVEEYGELFICNQLNKEVDISNIIDKHIPYGKNEKGPSVGEYFLYSIWNRMINPTSKNLLSDWYRKTAINFIRPIDIKQLTSQKYWDKWDRVSESLLMKISRDFFSQVKTQIKNKPENVIFDTTNYYTYMATNTSSELLKRGKNKESKHHLRQVGCRLLVDNNSRIPMYYKTYPGNIHDSKLFESVMDDMFASITGLDNIEQKLTVVIDKGMNSNSNFKWIDKKNNINFVTTYSTYFAKELAQTPLTKFEELDIQSKSKENILAFRSKGIFWGKERTAVVTYNSSMARKKKYKLEEKLLKIKEVLNEYQQKIKREQSQWKNKEIIIQRYENICKDLHISNNFYKLEFKNTSGKLNLVFKKDSLNIKNEILKFGKNIIITDNHDWSTQKIVKASFDRWKVESNFRDSKNIIEVNPIRHWTDSKIRCHLFSCVIALTYMRIFENKLLKNKLEISSESAMEQMASLHSVLKFQSVSSKPVRTLEAPTKTQTNILKAFGYKINKKWVLQKI